MRDPWQGTKTKKGYWRVTVAYRDEYGRARRKAFDRKALIDSQNAARIWLAKHGRFVECEPAGTLSDLFEHVDRTIWKETSELNRADMGNYRKRWEKALGPFEVQSIEAPILTRALGAMCEGKSASYIAKAARCIRQALDYAVSDLGWLQSNPARGMRRPKATRSTRTYPPMSRAEYERMLALADPRKRLLVRLMGECGMRPSEAVRVRPEHLSSVRDRWLVQIVKSKTIAGVRHVPVSDSLAREIEAWEPFGMDKPLYHLGHWWRENSATRMYDLRGWCADEWRRRGVPDQIRTWLMGHRQVQFTQRVYEEITASDTLEMFSQ